MSDKARLLQEADEAFAELRQAAGGLSEDEVLRPWLGAWGVREILVHVAGWHREMIPALGRIGDGEPPYSAGTYDDFDAWNTRFVERKAGVKVADVLAELDGSYRDFVAAAAALPDEHFSPGATARDVLEGSGPPHYREHAAQIREWRKGAR
ncbi:MAG: ClbS/DfsB family four-helix bundle protein [Candidatus Rokuibacteriota bacterium]